MRSRRRSVLVLLALLFALVSPLPTTTAHAGTPASGQAVDHALAPAGRVMRVEVARVTHTAPSLDAATLTTSWTPSWRRVGTTTAPTADPAYRLSGGTQVRGPPHS